jgi:hypothetical protein
LDDQRSLSRDLALQEPEPLEADTHRNRRDQKLFGERPSEILKSLIVARLVKCTERQRHLVFCVALHSYPFLPTEHAGMIMTEFVAPCLHDQFARHQQT